MAYDAKRNIFEIDFAGNADLQKIFAHKEPGDECELTITLVVNEINEKGVKATIKKVASDYGEGDEKTAEPTATEPVAMKVLAMPGKSGEAYG